MTSAADPGGAPEDVAGAAEDGAGEAEGAAGRPPGRGRARALAGWAVALFVALSLALGLRAFVFQVFSIPSLPCARLGNRSQPTATVLA